jgi:hypothetical protein
VERARGPGLRVLAPHRRLKVAVADDAASLFVEREERGVEHCVADLPAREVALRGDISQAGRADAVRVGQVQTPDGEPLLRVGRLEVDGHVEAALEGRVDAVARVRGDDDDALVVFEALEEVVGFEVRVAVVRRLHVRAVRHQRVAFVDQ